MVRALCVRWKLYGLRRLLWCAVPATLLSAPTAVVGVSASALLYEIAGSTLEIASAQARGRGDRRTRERHDKFAESFDEPKQAPAPVPPPALAATPAPKAADGQPGQTAKDDKKDANPSQGRKAGGTDGTEKAGNDPPRTLVELYNRIFKPAPPPAPAPRPLAATPRGTAPPAPAVAPPGKAPPPAVRRPGRVVTSLGVPPHTSQEVLAVNPSAAAVQHALALGFSIARPSIFAHIKSNVTPLLAPPGLSAVEARDILRRDLPTEAFALNLVYRTYKMASDGERVPARNIEPAGEPGAATPCKGDRCAARGLVGWKDELHSCSRGLRIGVIDTEVDRSHPAFAGRRLHHGSVIPEGANPAPSWHGTGVLAILAGNSASGTPGLIPDAEFFLASAFFTDSSGGFITDTVSILRALDLMAAFEVKLVNMSFAGPKDELVGKAIAAMSAKRVVFVAAAGNEGPIAAPSYPAGYRQVIAVTAVTNELRNYPFASRGTHIDLAAPGVGVWTAVPGRKEGYHTGTSFAAPYVTALIATIYKSNQRFTKAELLSRFEVKDLGPPGPDPIYGQGLPIAPSSCRPEAIARAASPRLAVIPTSSQR